MGISLFVLGGCTALNPVPVVPTPSLAPTSTPAPIISMAPVSSQKWSGTWTNSLGENGGDTLVISSTSSGKITGTWSGNINVTGQWLDKSSLKFSGRTDTRDYQVTGKLQNGTLTLNYTATRLNSSGTYTGEEKLTLTSK
jgi:hypothetical protein